MMIHQNISHIKDNFLRTMLWQNLWDMVLDVELPVTEYLDLVLKNIHLEKNPEILELLLSNIEQAFNWLTVTQPIPTKFKPYLKDLEFVLLEQTQLADNDTDLQKIWFNALTAMAHTEHTLNYLSAWLQGKSEPKLLNDDQDRRWQVVIMLNRYNHANADAHLKEEKRYDASDKGSMMHLAALASKPQLAVKQYWLDELIRVEQRQSAAHLKQAMLYLFPSNQAHLQKPLANTIIKNLHYLDKNRGQVLVDKFVNSILPTLCTESSVTHLQDVKNDLKELGLIASKGIKIAHQEDKRCIAIHALLDAESIKD